MSIEQTIQGNEFEDPLSINSPAGQLEVWSWICSFVGRPWQEVGWIEAHKDWSRRPARKERPRPPEAATIEATSPDAYFFTSALEEAHFEVEDAIGLFMVKKGICINAMISCWVKMFIQQTDPCLVNWTWASWANKSAVSEKICHMEKSNNCSWLNLTWQKESWPQSSLLMNKDQFWNRCLFSRMDR